MEYQITKTDSLLQPYRNEIDLRMNRYTALKKRLLFQGESLRSFASGYLYYGLHRESEGWVFREWLPHADEVFLMGDFNAWNHSSHSLKRIADGVWEIHIPGADALREGQYYKLWIRNGKSWFERIPAYVNYTAQDEKTHRLCARVHEERLFPWGQSAYAPNCREAPLIYEAHIGMAQEKEGVGSYQEFTENVLPRIAALGYNTVQLMAIAEHPYYGSFGYQVTNFYAPSYRYGESDDLKELIRRAHEMGLRVLMDVVHSHACPNVGEGLNQQDGSNDQYFIPGPEGWHPAWNTLLFNYAKPEVIHFLLSNLKYWLEEFHFDGFRFDGVTSMLYKHHGLGISFMNYKQYFSMDTNMDALNYLQLATELVHEVRPDALCIAEDMSGMPGIALPIHDGGIGFDYRLGMGVPDYWIRLTKEYRMEDWDLGRLWYELTTRRPGEKTVAYCESHDQALVGDQTLIFRMAGAAMYTGMNIGQACLQVDIAIDMHKLIRLITLCTGGEAYLNFMGNEFGHPEWIDFPREGNGWSHHYARRQWSLVDSHKLKYSYLLAFDQAMLAFAKENKVLEIPGTEQLWLDPQNKILVFTKGKCLYLFNFHPTRSTERFCLRTGSLGPGSYKVIFSTDDAEFGGQGRISKNWIYETGLTQPGEAAFSIYSPCHTAMILARL